MFIIGIINLIYSKKSNKLYKEWYLWHFQQK
jgi:hypothetical protein